MGEGRGIHVAIVGAGVSGIFTAIELKKLGYSNVTLYESSDRVASLAHTFSHDNYNFDFSTKLIPSIGLTHDDIYPPLLDLFKVTGITLGTPPVPRFYDFKGERFMNLPEPLARFKKIKVIRDFAKAYGLLEQISACSSLADVLETGIIRHGENVEAWAQRHGVEAFGALTNYIVDLFNIGPAYLVPAEFVLVSRVHFLAPYLHAVLSRTGVRHYYKLFKGDRSKNFSSFLDFEKKETNYYLVKEGYSEFFRRVVQHYGLNVRCNSRLSALAVDTAGISFRVNDQETVQCDKLIFCCPPSAIAALVPHVAVRTLFEGISPRRTIRTWAFEADGWDRRVFGDTAYIADYNNPLGIGTHNFKPNGELLYMTRESAQSELMVSAVYVNNDATEAGKHAALERSLKEFELSLKRVVAYRDFTWPHHASLTQVGNNWYEQVQAFQGSDGLYFSGECLSGIGVPTILEHSIKFVQKYFRP